MRYRGKNESLEEGLARSLHRCELEYLADYYFPELCEIEWLNEACESIDGIVAELRDLGYRIREIVDDVDSSGEAHQWVVTTNGIVVFRNSGKLRGLAGRSRV